MKASRQMLIATAISLAVFAASIARAAAPGEPTLVSPGGRVSGSTVNFLWNPVPSATEYQLQVKSGSVSRLNRTFTSTQASCSGGSGTCSAEVTIGNGAAAMTWSVRAGNADGFGGWSDEKNLVMTNEMRGPISKLPFTVSNPGSYYVTGNLTSTGNGIIVNADDVAIDLNGYTLTGPGASSGGNSGIYIESRRNVEIRNGTVREFGAYGIINWGADSRNIRVIGITLRENGNNGMYLSGHGNLVQNCTAYLNGDTGISAGYYSKIADCASLQNGNYGISGHTGCTITGNNAANNATVGIGASDGNVISGNTSNNNTMHGISAVGRGNTITDNTVRQNESAGLNAAMGNTVIGNTAYSNSLNGIQVSSGCTVKNNTSSFNQQNGISLGAKCLVDGNTADQNNQSGGAYVNITACADCEWGLNVK